MPEVPCTRLCNSHCRVGARMASTGCRISRTARTLGCITQPERAIGYPQATKFSSGNQILLRQPNSPGAQNVPLNGSQSGPRPSSVSNSIPLDIRAGSSAVCAEEGWVAVVEGGVGQSLCETPGKGG